jgi:hypothetical protein
MITPPSNQNRILLYIETELISTTFAAVLVSILKLLHSQLHPTPFPFISVFSAMSGISAVILGISITAATQKLRPLILSCRVMFHMPFMAAIVHGASLAFQGPLAGTIVFLSL